MARAGAKWLGVADTAEGVATRAALTVSGVARIQQPRILVLYGLLNHDADAIVEHRLTPVVWNQQQMEWLADAVARRDLRPLPVHLEIDTGMARQGVANRTGLRSMLRWLSAQKNLQLEGVMTHFVSSQVAGSPLTIVQRYRFENAIQEVSAVGLHPAWVHAGNSSTLDNDAADGGSLTLLRQVAARVGARAMVRAGIGLYGYCLPTEFANNAGALLNVRPQVRPELRPVMTWKTQVIGVHEVETGDTVGYNATFVAQHQMRLALLPVGYSNGLRRELSSTTTQAGGWVMMHGRRAAIVGRVSMNLTVVDVTEIPRVRVGDEVTVLGDGITADDHAQLAGTIAYEIVCGVRATSRLVNGADAM